VGRSFSNWCADLHVCAFPKEALTGRKTNHI